MMLFNDFIIGHGEQLNIFDSYVDEHPAALHNFDYNSAVKILVAIEEDIEISAMGERFSPRFSNFNDDDSNGYIFFIARKGLFQC